MVDSPQGKEPARGSDRYDAIVIGSGPNGLTAAVVLARAGLSVMVVEGQETIGGGARTEALTLPGFLHDVCSAIHPTGVISPAFKELELERNGVEWIYPPVALAHPLPDGSAGLLMCSVTGTGASLGPDAEAWAKIMQPFLQPGAEFFHDILRPIRVPAHPFRMLRFGTLALQSCAHVVRNRFVAPTARALFTGCAAHSVLPLEQFGTASFGLILALAGHAIGWPCVRGGSQAISRTLAKQLRTLGGEIETGHRVHSLNELPPSRVVLMDITPRQIVSLAGEELPASFCRKLAHFRYAPGVFKIDWALSAPVPWKNPECRRAGTVHLGGTAEEIMVSERAVASGQIPEKPFIIFAQTSLFDASVAPPGKHTAWGYCHVPPNCTVDMTECIERSIEQCAPGFRDIILSRHTWGPKDFERHNPNLVGGDIGGGANNLWQLLFRPVPRWNPYTTPNPRLYICSSSTPPGGGVHGMCGYWAAQAALSRIKSGRV